MITVNLKLGMPWEAYRQLTIIPAMAKRLLPQGGMADAAPLKARVNHGRWLVDCECSGAEIAFDECVFMCQSCWNAQHKHQYRPVLFPQGRQAIEQTLLQRPVPNRNWEPGDTLTQLKAENEAHKEELL